MSQNPFDDLKIPKEFQSIIKNLRVILLSIIIVVMALGSFFQVGPEEVGVVTRFGQYIKTVDPGLNFKLPFMEKVQKVPVERQQKLEFGFRTIRADVRSTSTRDGSLDESLMLTGDLNLADVEWVVQYRIDNPYNFLFKVRNPVSTLRDVSEATMREVVGDRTVNEVLTVGRAEIAGTLKELVQKVCREYTLGVKIDQVVLQDVNPPEPVKAAFNAVNEAQQEKETLINQAKAEYNKVIPKASGQAQETIQKAEGYATERVNIALGEVARFNEVYKEYVKAPEVTKRRLYQETMQEVLPRMGNKIITDDKANSVLPLLQMQFQNKKTE